jgi:tetratricopeptide (TPR) repeat protein
MLMSRKKELPASDGESQPEPEKIPVVTPEIEDGYNGVVKRRVCLGCQRIFYLTEADCQLLHPTHCHTCSTKLVAEYEAKRQQEITEQEQKVKDEILFALLADLAKKDTPEEAYVRRLVETNFKKDWNYGFKMLMCFPRHIEKGRMWKVVLTKQEENPKRSIHIRLLLIEWAKNCHMYLPYDESVFYEKSIEAELEEIDRLIEQEPTKAGYYEMKADKLVKLGEDQQALLCYERAMELDAPNAYRYCSKGVVLARLDRAGEAMECYEKAISLEPDRLFGYIRKARLLEQLGRGEEALALYDAFIEAHPTELEGYLQKAMWYIKQDKFEEAREIHLQGRLAAQKAD